MTAFATNEARSSTPDDETKYQDSAQLARLGKKSILKRNFNFFSILGLSCTVLITWEGSLVLFGQGLQNGGSAGVIYSFLLVWLGNLSVFSTLSELVSMAPTSGGQYYWVSMLAPRSSAKFLSYVTGWLSVGGWLGTVASGGYLTASILKAVITITIKSYTPHDYQGTLLLWAVMSLCVFINAVTNHLLPLFESFILVVHLTGFVAVIVPLLVLADHADSSTVFTSFNNGGNWPSQGLSFFVGMIGNVFAFVGADAAFHMSEEVNNAVVVVPQSVMLGMLLNGTLGFSMILAVLFCMGQLPEESQTGFPFMDIFLNATKSPAGATAMSSIIILMCFCATVGVFTSTSRILWSFARDHGVPFWRTLSKVDSRTTVPMWSIAATGIISCLLALINIGSSTAFNNVVSLSISGLYSSYLMAAGLLLYRRCTHGFKLPSPTALPALATDTHAELVWGPWHIPGIFGIVNNSLACVYLIIVCFFSFWPPVTPVTADTMNYSVLVTGTVTVFSIVYYLVWAKKEYHGPTIEI